MKKKVLIVGPIHPLGLGGRFEEMKVWTNSLEELGCEITVFSMFNSKFSIGKANMFESGSLMFPVIWKFPFLRQFIIRVCGSKFFKKFRDDFYHSKKWVDFSSSFDHIILFITHLSREIKIFESSSPIPISLRFTGTIPDFSIIQKHNQIFPLLLRNYVFHSSFLAKGLNTPIKKYFIDQTTLAESTLLNLPITSGRSVFGMIGLFMEVKKIDEIIRVFKDFPKLKLILFGSGELESTYLEIILAMKISNVEFAGFVPSSKIHEVYSRIDCLIINSTSETGPMTGIEAMAAGKLILSRPVGAMPDRINFDDLIYDSVVEFNNKIRNLLCFSDEKIVHIKNEFRRKYLMNYSNKELKALINNLIS